MGIETWKTFPKLLNSYPADNMPLPCSDQNPKLKCPETRWARDFCLSIGGACEYKIEAHFDCLEQYYPKDKVLQLRKAFKPNHLDYPTSDTYIRYRHHYIGNPWMAKSGWEGTY
jgi:hypothetical protein